MSVMALRSSSGWRSTMSISLSPSRNCPTLVPDKMVRDACAIDWLVTPNALALDWSTCRRSILTASFQLSFTPRVLALSRKMFLTSSARARSTSGSLPTTRNCTGYGTGGPLGNSLTRPRTSGNSAASKAGSLIRNDSRSVKSFGTTINCDTLVCGKTWSSGR